VALTAGLKKLAEKDAAGALAQFREAVRLDPQNARAHDQLGRALKAQGQAAEGDRHLAEARRLAPYLAPPAVGPAPP
jgi:Flp pilus assembly protein TadD